MRNRNQMQCAHLNTKSWGYKRGKVKMCSNSERDRQENISRRT